MATGLDGDFERDPLLTNDSRVVVALKAEVDCLDLSVARGPDADTRSTLDIVDRSAGPSCDMDLNGKDGLALEPEPDADGVSVHCRCGFGPDGLVWMGMGGEGLPVAVAFQELFPGDCVRFREPMDGRGKDPTADVLGFVLGGTADAAEGEDALASVRHCWAVDRGGIFTLEFGFIAAPEARDNVDAGLWVIFPGASVEPTMAVQRGPFGGEEPTTRPFGTFRDSP